MRAGKPCCIAGLRSKAKAYDRGLPSACVEAPRLAFQGWCGGSVSKRLSGPVCFLFCSFSKLAVILKVTSRSRIAAEAPAISTTFLASGRRTRRGNEHAQPPIQRFSGSPIQHALLLYIGHFCNQGWEIWFYSWGVAVPDRRGLALEEVTLRRYLSVSATPSVQCPSDMFTKACLTNGYDAC